MNERAVFEHTVNRLLERAVGAEQAWEELWEAGLADVLLGEEASFSAAATVLTTAAHHPQSTALAETVLGRHFLSLAGLAIPDGPLAVSLSTQSPTLGVEAADGRLVLDGYLEQVSMPISAAAIVAVVGGVGGGMRWLVSIPAPFEGLEPWQNRAGEQRSRMHFRQIAVSLDRCAPVDGEAAIVPMLVGAFLRSAQIAGALDRCLALSLQHAQERRQFGRSIAAFQAVQHMLAQIASERAAVRSAVLQAADALDHGGGALQVAIAKSRASEAAGRVAALAHQVHGAMGFTWEHSLGVSTRRLWSWREDFGNEHIWNAILGDAAIGWGDETWSRLVDGMAEADRDIRAQLARRWGCR